MSKSKVENALIEGLKEALEFEKGHRQLKTSHRELPQEAPEFSRDQIRKLRKETFKATQEEFAIILNVELSTLRSWEQGLRRPTKAANRLLEIIKKKPSIIELLVG